MSAAAGVRPSRGRSQRPSRSPPDRRAPPEAGAKQGAAVGVGTQRDEAITFLDKLTVGDKDALEWAKSIPLASSDELATYH